MSMLSSLLGHNKATLAAIAHLAEMVFQAATFQRPEHQTQAGLVVAGLNALAADAASHDNGANLKALIAPIVAEAVVSALSPQTARTPFLEPAQISDQPDQNAPDLAFSSPSVTEVAPLQSETQVQPEEKPFVSDLPEPTPPAPPTVDPATEAAMIAPPTDHTQVNPSDMTKAVSVSQGDNSGQQ